MTAYKMEMRFQIENTCPKKAIINGIIISRPKQTATKKRVCLILVIFDKITKNAATLIKDEQLILLFQVT